VFGLALCQIQDVADCPQQSRGLALVRYGIGDKELVGLPASFEEPERKAVEKPAIADVAFRDHTQNAVQLTD